MSYKVVVVDDDYDVVEALTDYLKIKGITVMAIGNDGKKAIELYEKYKPSAVLLDAKMPKYDGFYATEKIMGLYPEAKIIIATASISQNTANRLMEMNAKAIIYKPYDIDNVVETIKRVCNGETLPVPIKS